MSNPVSEEHLKVARARTRLIQRLAFDEPRIGALAARLALTETTEGGASVRVDEDRLCFTYDLALRPVSEIEQSIYDAIKRASFSKEVLEAVEHLQG